MLLRLCVIILTGIVFGFDARAVCDTIAETDVTMYMTPAVYSDGPTESVITGTIIPAPLRAGDTVAIVSPSGEAHSLDMQAVRRTLEDQGWKVMVGPHASGRHGTYSGTPGERLSDLRWALTHPDVKAVICTRGGYGAVHLLDSLDRLPLRENPRWVVGFSDISAIHALMTSHGIASVHGPMALNMAAPHHISGSVQALFDILRGDSLRYVISGHPYNRPGKARSVLVGGNLAVIDGLASTPYDCFLPGTILFIEDVSEPIYKIERILYRLKLSGVLDMIDGLIVGAFTDVAPDHNYSNMEQMIRDVVSDYDFPVAFGVPAGHVKVNVPFILGTPVTLEVTDTETIITQ